MMRALFCHGSQTAPERLVQLAGLMEELGLATDQLLIGAPSTDWPLLPEIATRRMARIPVDAIRASSRPGETLARLTAGRGYRVICGFGPEAAGLVSDGAGMLRLFDCTSSHIAEVAADFRLTGLLRPGGAAAGAGGAALLPAPWPGDLAPMRLAPRGIGWAGAWPDGLASAWSELLTEIAARTDSPDHEIFLAGPGAADVSVPETLRGIFRADTDRIAATRRVLGAAVIPLTNLAPLEPDISAMLAGHTPVLALEAGLEGAAAPWQIPSHSDIAELAVAIAAFRADPARRSALVGLTRQTATGWEEAATRAPGRLVKDLRFALGL